MALLTYGMRVVETGALLKDLTDARNVSPGMAAITGLHGEFLLGTTLNVSPRALSRSQFSSILSRKIPWKPQAEVRSPVYILHVLLYKKESQTPSRDHDSSLYIWCCVLIPPHPLPIRQADPSTIPISPQYNNNADIYDYD